MLRDDDAPLPKEKCDPINIRDSYFGGRTNAIVLHREFPPNSHGGYLDFCSLYPYILKYERYPIMYHDTDSVIYICCPGQWKLPIGKYLGDLADELACHEIGCPGCSTGHWIVEFVSCGAKNYAYRLDTGQVMCKVGGFSLNFSASQVVNLNSMKQAIHIWRDVNTYLEMVTLKTMIMCDKLTAIVYTCTMPKHYGVVYNKCVVNDDFSTIPFGY